MYCLFSILLAASVSFADLSAATNRPSDVSDVTIEGEVIDVIPDDIDQNYRYLMLRDGDMAIPVAYNVHEQPSMDALIGAQARVHGVYLTKAWGIRAFFGPYVELKESGSITVLKQPPTDPFQAPGLERAPWAANPYDLVLYGRRRVTGTVVAVWEEDNLLVSYGQPKPLRVILRSGLTPPPIGSRVTVVGETTTDLFHLVLNRAIFRVEPSETAIAANPPKSVSLRALYGGKREKRGLQFFEASHDLSLVRLRGTVRRLPSDETGSTRLILADGNFEAVVDLSANPRAADGLSVGCTAEATGVYIINAPLWTPSQVFPRVTGFTVVPRSPADIVLVARPPWWTPLRLCIVIGALLLFLVAALVWNVSLRILAERRGRELFRSQARSAAAKLKVEERTRLAVELHDSLSQTLTGVSLELAAADDANDGSSPEMRRHLATAGRTLQSCRAELRNCLWDLRSDALGETDMTRAILRTLQPLADRNRLVVRFNVPRARLSDNTAHALLRIIRELVVNALNHGQATSVWIAGSLDRDALRFSVRDDGRGFDPDDCPGVAQGHFGLEGIRERLAHLGGTLTIDSAPGQGTRVAGTIPAPQPAQTRN